MTAKEFAKELKNLNLEWTAGHIMRFMRCRLKGPHKNYCPVTALCFIKTGKSFSVDEFKLAAKTIGLEPETASCIVRAADSIDSPDTFFTKIEECDNA